MVDTIQAVRSRDPVKFEAHLQRVREAGTDNLSHFGCGYTHEGGYSLQQNPYEFAALLTMLEDTLLDRHDLIYLEIGSASGGAARMLHEVLKFNAMLSIDDGGHHRYPELAKNFEGLPMEHLKADSHGPQAANWLVEQSGGTVEPDVIFIDGDHSETGVWQDVQLVRTHWRSGAMVIFHDIVACDGVKKAWQRGIAEKLWVPLAEYIGDEKPLGIGVGFVL